MRKKHYESYAAYSHVRSSTQWTSTEDVKKRLTKLDLTKGNTVKAGGMPIISDGKTAYVDAGDSHSVIVASSGMKKTLCAFMPLVRILAMASENMCITDPKGEIFHRTAGFLVSQGYTVRCLDFRTMDKDGFNILFYPALVYRKEDKEKGLSLLSDIINTLAEPQKRYAKDPFWPETGAQWLNGTGGVMLESYPRIEQVNVLNWSDFNCYGAAKLLEEHIIASMADNTVKRSFQQSCSSAENTFRSILITASSFLATFNQNPKLAAMLSHSTFTLEDLTKPKTALFLVTDDTTSTTDIILGMIISQIQSYLVDHAYHSKEGRLERRMNFLLDEFASIPIPNMDKALATHRSRNIRYYLCVQSLSLLQKRYENPEALLANCAAMLYLGSTELELLQKIEIKLGKTSITPDGSERSLCTLPELMTLEKTWDHKEGIYMNLAENIRYCTMLPCIETYEKEIFPAPCLHIKTPDIQTYSVAEFVSDVKLGKISAPFAPVSTRKKPKGTAKNRYPQGKPSIEDGDSDKEIDEEWLKDFQNLFGSDEDE